MMALLLVGLATTEVGLYFAGRPLLSNQHGFLRVGVFAAWAVLGGHLVIETLRDRVIA